MTKELYFDARSIVCTQAMSVKSEKADFASCIPKFTLGNSSLPLSWSKLNKAMHLYFWVSECHLYLYTNSKSIVPMVLSVSFLHVSMEVLCQLVWELESKLAQSQVPLFWLAAHSLQPSVSLSAAWQLVLAAAAALCSSFLPADQLQLVQVKLLVLVCSWRCCA